MLGAAAVQCQLGLALLGQWQAAHVLRAEEADARKNNESTNRSVENNMVTFFFEKVKMITPAFFAA